MLYLKSWKFNKSCFLIKKGEKMAFLRQLFFENENINICNDTELAYITEFNEGYALAIKKANSWDFGDVVIIDENHYEVENTGIRYWYSGDKKINWKNGYISANYNGYQIFLDTNLQRVEEHQYDNILFDSFDDGYIEVVQRRGSEELRGVLDEDLNFILRPDVYDVIMYLHNHKFLAIYKKEDKTIVYDNRKYETKRVDGKIISMCMHNELIYYKFIKDGKYGYYNEDVEVAVKNEYEKLNCIDGSGRILFVQNGNTGVLNIQTGEKKII